MRCGLPAVLIAALVGVFCHASDWDRSPSDLERLPVGAQCHLDMAAPFALTTFARRGSKTNPSAVWLEGTVSKLTPDEIILTGVVLFEQWTPTQGVSGAFLTQPFPVSKSWVRAARRLTPEERDSIAGTLAEEKKSRYAAPTPPGVSEAIARALLHTGPKRACSEDEVRDGEACVIEEIRRNMDHARGGPPHDSGHGPER